MRPEAGQWIAGKYLLERRLARGGMGSVWRAKHVPLDAPVALKFPHFDEKPSDRAVERFQREARLAAIVKSPHTVHIHDFGFEGETPYLAMELLVGEDLGLVLDRRGALDPNEALDWIRQAGLGLEAVHRAGLVHRDVKPSNLFVVDESPQRIKLLDFGIAKEPVADAGLTTEEGLVLGSAAYMSPEQARGKMLDPRSDLWSLSAVFYRMLTGELPFSGTSTADIVVRACTERLERPSSKRLALGTRFDAFFERAFEKRPDARFQSVSEMLDALEVAANGADFATSSRRSAPPVQRGRDDETAPLPLVTDPEAQSKATSIAAAVPRFVAAALVVSIAAGALYWRSGKTRANPPSTELGSALPAPARQVETRAASAPPPTAMSSELDPAACLPGRTCAAPAPSRDEAAPPRSAKPRATTGQKEESTRRTDPIFGLPVPNAP